jgi:hypothetical protein
MRDTALTTANDDRQDGDAERRYDVEEISHDGRSLVGGLQDTQEPQQQDDHQQGRDTPAGIVAPAATVGPGRDQCQQQDNQDDHEDEWHAGTPFVSIRLHGHQQAPCQRGTRAVIQPESVA